MGIAAADQFTTILYTTNDETWTVNPFVVIAVASGEAVNANFERATLNNHGVLYTSTSFSNAVFSGGDGSTLTNFATGFIKGANGLGIAGLDVEVFNNGVIYGRFSAGILLDYGDTDLDLTNRGTIFGVNAGFAVLTSSSTFHIDNRALISSSQHGIQILALPSVSPVIDNGAAGVIRGAMAAIYTDNGGAMVLNNRGLLDGGIDCNNYGVDVVTNRGRILGEVQLGGGADRFIGTGGRSGKILGEAGADVLAPGLSQDRLVGGSEADRFDFNTIADSVVGAKRDQILDFSAAQNDIIDVRTIDAKTTVAGNQAFKYIAAQPFHGVAGELRFAGHILAGDVNGDGRADFETRVNANTLSAAPGGDIFL